MYSSPVKSAGALWRSERIHLTDISRAPDNGIVRCDSRWNRQENDNRMHKLPNMESCRRCCVDADKLSSCCIENMSETMFSPIRSFSNDGSDFSDASLSVACSTSATSGQYQTVNNSCPDGCCLECINQSARSSPQRRRRRKIVSRSLVLEPGVDGFSKPSRRPSSGRSDSSILARGERCQDDSESSSSNYSTTAVKGVRRKPKSHRRCVPPPPYCRIGYRNPVVAPRPVYANCYSSLPWVCLLGVLLFMTATGAIGIGEIEGGAVGGHGVGASGVAAGNRGGSGYGGRKSGVSSKGYDRGFSYGTGYDTGKTISIGDEEYGGKGFGENKLVGYGLERTGYGGKGYRRLQGPFILLPIESLRAAGL